MRFPRVTVGRMMLAIAVVALVLGGVVLAFGPRKVELRPHPLPTRVNVDHDIFDVALADLLKDDDLEQFGEGEKKQLLLDVRTEEGDLFELRYLDVLEKSFDEKRIAAEIVDDFNERNPRKVRFDLTGYRPSSPDIVVRDLDADPRMRDFLRQMDMPPWVQVWLPSYSKDGRVAFLRLSFGPSPHGSDAYYLLKKVNG